MLSSADGAVLAASLSFITASGNSDALSSPPGLSGVLVPASWESEVRVHLCLLLRCVEEEPFFRFSLVPAPISCALFLCLTTFLVAVIVTLSFPSGWEVFSTTSSCMLTVAVDSASASLAIFLLLLRDLWPTRLIAVPSSDPCESWGSSSARGFDSWSSIRLALLSVTGFLLTGSVTNSSGSLLPYFGSLFRSGVTAFCVGAATTSCARELNGPEACPAVGESRRFFIIATRFINLFLGDYM